MSGGVLAVMDRLITYYKERDIGSHPEVLARKAEYDEARDAVAELIESTWQAEREFEFLLKHIGFGWSREDSARLKTLRGLMRAALSRANGGGHED